MHLSYYPFTLSENIPFLQKRLIEMKNKKEPRKQTGAYLAYVTV